MSIPRIAQILEEGRWGGPQLRATQIARHLLGKGIRTVIFMPKKESDFFCSQLKKNELEFHRINLTRLTKDPFTLINYFFTFFVEIFTLAYFLKKEQCNIVHCNGAYQIKGAIAGRLAGKKVIWHLNDTKQPWLVHKIFYHVSKLAHGFIVAAESVQNYYLPQNLKDRPVSIIQAPVDTAFLNPDSIDPAPDILALNGPKIVITANIVPVKGLEYFIEMAAHLMDKNIRANYIIVGAEFSSQKRYKKMIHKLIEKYHLNNVHFLGQRADVPAILRASDIYVCSSINEASPISVWEAMSMGKSIVSTDVGDVAKFIKEGETGFIVPTCNAEKLAEKVKILIENPEMRKEFGRRARETAVRHLDIKIAVRKHENFYRQIING